MIRLPVILVLASLASASPKETISESPSKPVLKIHLFAASDCEECRELKDNFLPPILERHGGRVVCEHVPTDDIEGFKKLLLFEKRYGSESDEAVRLFVGNRALAGIDEIKRNIESLIEAELESGAASPRTGVTRAKPERDVDGVANEKLKAFRPGIIALAGLIDGINPCAFVTLVFFISVLANLRKSAREILVVGLAFSLSVFVTYLALGLGLFRAVKLLSVSFGVARMVNLGVAALTLLLAFLSFRDFLKCSRGEPKTMTLKLPDSFRRIINRMVNTRMRRGHLVFWSFVLGFVVSILESMCTGQIYLPTIMYVLREGRENLVKAFLYLVLYNAAFVVPLLVVFGMAFFGVSSKSITGWFNRNLALSKLMMTLLFLTLGLVLIFGT